MKIKYGSNKSSRWACGPDRVLFYDGKPVAYLGIPSRSALISADADDLAEFITFLLNEEDATPERGPITVLHSAGEKSQR